MKVKLNSSKAPPANQKQRDLAIYWNLCHAVRHNTIDKDRVDKQINFVLANSKTEFPKLEAKFLELRKRNNYR